MKQLDLSALSVPEFVDWTKKEEPTGPIFSLRDYGAHIGEGPCVTVFSPLPSLIEILRDEIRPKLVLHSAMRDMDSAVKYLEVGDLDSARPILASLAVSVEPA